MIGRGLHVRFAAIEQIAIAVREIRIARHAARTGDARTATMRAIGTGHRTARVSAESGVHDRGVDARNIRSRDIGRRDITDQ